VILSDRSIKEALAEKRIVIDPIDEKDVQPSSVDLHIDRYFRVFRNDTTPYIDPKQPQEDLTEIVEVNDGDAFILHPGEFVLGSTYERVALPDDLVARLEGKALALDTEVPTPSGWTTMGELRPGDLVFDDRGEPTVVVAATSPFYDRPCREVVFSEGSSVVADICHLWETVDKNGRRYGKRRTKVLSTEAISQSLHVRGERNHQVMLAAPVNYPEQQLPIDPYVLGVWLGDGTSTKPEITTADPFVAEEIERCGYSMVPKFHRGPYLYLVGGAGHTRDAKNGQYTRNSSFHSALRNNGLLGNKHIPELYMRASVAQRMALLQGLMDSDGYIDKAGRCDFVSTKWVLAEQTHELVASLGLRPTMAKKRAKLNGVDCGPFYEVQFTPDRPVFRLPRKLARLKTTGKFHRFRAIHDVRHVLPVPVRCIEVASPRGMFLVTRSYIPTHNSSLGRLGLLIHSSLPASETVFVLEDDGTLRPRPIGEVVAKQLPACVVAFDPETFTVDYHRITGWYEGPADRIFEVRLASGRSVRLTAGHNLFTLGRDGALTKLRTGEITPDTLVALPRSIPDATPAARDLRLVELVPEAMYERFTVSGPSIERAFVDDRPAVSAILRDGGWKHVDYYERTGRLPMLAARLVPGLLEALGPDDRIGAKGGRNSLPAVLPIDAEIAWLLGIYVAEGSRRRNQLTISNTDQAYLDRAQAALAQWGLPVSRGRISITCCSSVASELFGWLGTGEYAVGKRVPPVVFGWPTPLIESFLEGLVDGDGSREEYRTSVWTCSDGLVEDLLVLAPRLATRAAVSTRTRGESRLHQVYFAINEHKLLTAVPLPNEMLRQLRESCRLDQQTAAHKAGYSNSSDLNNIEQRWGRDAVRRTTLARLDRIYREAGDAELAHRLTRLVEGDLIWDRVVEVVDTGAVEPIFDLEVRPNGRKIENFLAGSGGVFVSNTAGFVDAGWDGHLTLELSNVATLPIALYPRMKIGQISFFEMSTPAEHPYGSEQKGSKYQGQRGPTPSRYYLNFRDNDE
jgi:deoxycytidine triphosphate deaminase/intein/homing endonuclease